MNSVNNKKKEEKERREGRERERERERGRARARENERERERERVSEWSLKSGQQHRVTSGREEFGGREGEEGRETKRRRHTSTQAAPTHTDGKRLIRLNVVTLAQLVFFQQCNPISLWKHCLMKQ